jgi:hypothetical protein
MPNMTSKRCQGESNISEPFNRAARSRQCSIRCGLAEAGSLCSGSDSNLTRQLRCHNTPHDPHAIDGCRGGTSSCKGHRVLRCRHIRGAVPVVGEVHLNAPWNCRCSRHNGRRRQHGRHDRCACRWWRGCGAATTAGPSCNGRARRGGCGRLATPAEPMAVFLGGTKLRQCHPNENRKDITRA